MTVSDRRPADDRGRSLRPRCFLSLSLSCRCCCCVPARKLTVAISNGIGEAGTGSLNPKGRRQLWEAIEGRAASAIALLSREMLPQVREGG